MTETRDSFRDRILEEVRAYHRLAFPAQQFCPGETPVPISGRVFDDDELVHLVEASLDCWLTAGRFAALFEKQFAQTLGVRHALLCNSGSSANLLAMSTLTSPQLGERALRPGDEIITVAAGFPTTVNAILQNQLVPVLVDIELETYNADVAAVEAAVGPRTRGIMLAHTLGNPFDLDAVVRIATSHGLWLVEDNCDAVGSLYRGRHTGSFGDLASASFYPAHHITMGEGGAVLTDRPVLKTIAQSFRDWGRDCWCDPGRDNTCGKRFEWQLGDLPAGYDHKYIYSHIGYNLKATDMQAAVGVAQLKKLTRFGEARRRNWAALHDALSAFSEWLILPKATAGSDPSWFGFAVTLRPTAPFTRRELIRFLDERRIATRLLFAGNLVRQPAYSGAPLRVAGSLAVTDDVMHRTFWLGTYPGISLDMIAYVRDSLDAFLARH